MQFFYHIVHHQTRIDPKHGALAALFSDRIGRLLDPALLRGTFRTLFNLDLLLAVSNDILDGRPLLRVHNKHLVYYVQQLRRMPGARERRVICRNDFLEQVVQRHLHMLNLERALQCAKLVCNATEGPDIALEVVAVSLQDFGRHE